MAFAFDEGPTGSSEFDAYINWHARGTNDGDQDPRTFSIREGGDRNDVTAKMKKGVVLDINNLRTGWCHSEGLPGVAPDWRYNSNTARFEPKPDNDRDWKQGFCAPIAISQDDLAAWNQAGAGAWEAMKRLAKQIQEEAPANAGLLPVIVFTDTDELKFKKGGTSVPLFEIKKWVEAPPCLRAAPIATKPEPADEPADDAEEDDEF